MGISGEFSTPVAGLDDPVASLLHLGGALWFAWQTGRLVGRAGPARRRAAALAVFAGTALLVLGLSASYHALAPEHPWKAALQRADHGAIFLLIAGTLTSFLAIAFHGRGRFWMVALVWGLTAAAMTGKAAYWSEMGDGTGLGLYVGISALGLGAFLVLPRRVPWSAMPLMALGALVYVLGALADFWNVGRPLPGVFGPHELFHLAVLGALLLHWRFFSVWAEPGRVPPRGLPGHTAEERRSRPSHAPG